MSQKIKPSNPQINWNNPIARGLIFDLPFIERGGTSVRDLVRKLTGTFTGTPSWSIGQHGSGLAFTGHDADKVTFTTPPPLNDIHRISVEVMFIADATPSDGDRLFHKGVSSGAGARYFQTGEWVNGQGMYVAADWTGNQGAWRTPLPSTGVVHHYLVTYDDASPSNDPIVYLDGQVQSITEVVTPSGSRSADTTELYIGNRNSGSFSWKGKIFYIRYWNRILTYREVIELYRDPYLIYKRDAVIGKVPTIIGSTGQIKVWNGSAFVAKPVKVWNGSSWGVKPVKRWNGSAWITTPY